MACALILSLCILGGCSKDDDGPGSGSSKASGNVKVNGKSFDTKFGYKCEEDGEWEYMFFDKDIIKYVGSTETPNIEYSCIDFVCEDNELIFVAIGININPRNETGTEYYFEPYEDGDFYDYGSFSLKKGTIKSSAKSLPMTSYDIYSEEYLGTANANFSVEGSPKDVSDLYSGEFYDTRSLDIDVITDPAQIAFLKKLSPKHFISKK